MPGLAEILVVGSLLVVFFGSRKLPQLGRALGETTRRFRQGLKAEEPREVEPLHPPTTRHAGSEGTERI